MDLSLNSSECLLYAMVDAVGAIYLNMTRIYMSNKYSISLVCFSDGSYPKDEGSSQEVSQSLFVGESRNRGTNGGLNKYWGIGGVDGKDRTLPRNK